MASTPRVGARYANVFIFLPAKCWSYGSKLQGEWWDCRVRGETMHVGMKGPWNNPPGGIQGNPVILNITCQIEEWVILLKTNPSNARYFLRAKLYTSKNMTMTMCCLFDPCIGIFSILGIVQEKFQIWTHPKCSVNMIQHDSTCRKTTIFGRQSRGASIRKKL